MLSLIDNPVPWPNGARVAVCLSFDIDSDSILHLDHGDAAVEMLAAQSWLRYDRLAVPRLIRIFQHFQCKQTFFMPAWCMEQYPQVVDAILEAGHELAHHGYFHENPNQQPREDERYWLERSLEVFKTMTGALPKGSRAPLYNFSQASFDLLVDAGFRYDASLMGDDVPYVLRSGERELLELPSHWGMDDWPQYVHAPEFQYKMPIRAPSEAIKVYWDEFEAMWQHGGMLVAVWHPFVSGRLARAQAIVSLIERMLEKGAVWFASMAQIASHIDHLRAQGQFSPRIEPFPTYAGPVPRPRRP